MLESETLINLTTVAKVRHLLHEKAVDAEDDALILGLIRALSHDAMVRLMGRPIKYEERSEYFDTRKGQREYLVSASPIDTDEDITVVYNTDQPRDFTDTDDVIDSDYVICDADRANRGAIYLEYDLVDAPNALKITYTGGLAAETCVTGTDGVCDANGGSNNKFTSATGDFVNDGVTAYQDLLVITKGTNAGFYGIATVSSGTALLISSTFSSVGTTGEYYEIWKGGIAGSYPDIFEAVAQQTAHIYRNRSRFGIPSESAGGAAMTHALPINWLYVWRDIITSHARKRGNIL